MEESERKIKKAVRERFFDEFSESHREWLRELVVKYKKRGIFPVFPTQIIEYYNSDEDKEFAVFSALCMNWNNGNELEQIADMRRIIGDHPTKWFVNREFVTISIGREQKHYIDGNRGGNYWKIAKVYDLLYQACQDNGMLRYPSDVFRTASFKDFCDQVSQICQIPDMDHKRSIIELVLRTSDGIGRNLWPTAPRKVKCPVSVELSGYLRKWFPDWWCGLWSWDEAVHLFKLKHDYDFFYACLAYKELCETDPIGCRKYATRYQYRWNNQLLYPRRYWLGAFRIAPKIEFME